MISHHNLRVQINKLNETEVINRKITLDSKQELFSECNQINESIKIKSFTLMFEFIKVTRIQ